MTAHSTEGEERIRVLFGEVLEIAEIGVDDDFFAFGGHSMLAFKLIARIRAELGLELDFGKLFDTPTAAGIARDLGLTLATGARVHRPLSTISWSRTRNAAASC